MICAFPELVICDGGESRTAMLSFKASLEGIQLSLGRGQLHYFTFEFIPALRSCLICRHREFSMVGRASSCPSKGASAILVQCQPTRTMSEPAGQLQF